MKNYEAIQQRMLGLDDDDIGKVLDALEIVRLQNVGNAVGQEMDRIVVEIVNELYPRYLRHSVFRNIDRIKRDEVQGMRQGMGAWLNKEVGEE